ncbi:hypothetical protein [Paenibacillus sp. PAMC21692]|uniref:hypothetical protein n=1 Tax=Paenibacillus sp. PAMC21692 TaxID=2762320 RepID=UPI00164E5FA6|nr:hypothetical protein [Paenibacillus sp. PAMC21692]QNK54542.1 hypothetical protein H7F31_17930 [Paenibacillus sp. PAMC21692]
MGRGYTDGSENAAGIDTGHAPEEWRLYDKARPIIGIEDRDAEYVVNECITETVRELT